MVSAGRDERGLFVHGNPGSPGRKPHRVELAYLTAAREAVPTERWRKAVMAALDLADGTTECKPLEQIAALKALKDILLPQLEVPGADGRLTLDPSRVGTAELEALRATMRKMVREPVDVTVDVTPEKAKP